MQMEREWKRYPVLHMDLNAKKYNSYIFYYLCTKYA